MPAFVVYQFSRDNIRRQDFRHFVRLFRPDELPAGPALAGAMGTLVFTVEGYEHDRRELHSIPEVRRFYRTLWAAWPYGLYFGCLETDDLKMAMLSCLPSLSTVRRAGDSLVTVEFDPAEMTALVDSGLGHLRTLCVRASLPEFRVHERICAVREYFGVR